MFNIKSKVIAIAIGSALTLTVCAVPIISSQSDTNTSSNSLVSNALTSVSNAQRLSGSMSISSITSSSNVESIKSSSINESSSSVKSRTSAMSNSVESSSVISSSSNTSKGNYMINKSVTAKGITVKYLLAAVYHSNNMILIMAESNPNNYFDTYSDGSFTAKDDTGKALNCDTGTSPGKIIITDPNISAIKKIYITCDFIIRNTDYSKKYDELKAGAITQADFDTFCDAQPQTVEIDLQ